MADEQFYMRVRGKVSGPFDIATLQKLAKRGTLSRIHEVSTDRVAWNAAGQFDDLFPSSPANTAVVVPAQAAGSESIPDDAPELSADNDFVDDIAVPGDDRTLAVPSQVSSANISSAPNICPFCNEGIQYGAQKCKHCGEWLARRAPGDSRTIPYAQRLPREQPRSYLNSAVLTLILYVVGFGIVGLIANIVYLSSAQNEEARTGSVPEGKGCLVALIWVFVGGPLIIGLLILVFAAIAAISAR